MTQLRPEDAGVPLVADAHLVARALEGSHSAFGELVDRYEGLVGSIAYALTGSLAQSEEISQEVFVAAWQGLPRLRGDFNAWIRGIARKMSLRAVRDARRRIRPTTLDGRPDVYMAMASATPSPLEQIIDHEEEQAVWSALSRIPETYRIPLVLFYREQKSIGKVARMLDLSVENVRMRLYRGRRMLQEKVDLVLESAIRRRPSGHLSKVVVAAIAAGGLIMPGRASAATRLQRGVPKAALVVGAAIAILAPLFVVGWAHWVLAPRARDASGGAGNRESRAVQGQRYRSLSAALPSGATIGDSRTDVPRRALLQADFENGTSPFPFDSGSAITPCPGHPPPSSHCMVAGFDMPGGGSSYLQMGFVSNENLFRFTGSQTLSFDYWMETSDVRLTIQISGGDHHGQHYIRIANPAVRAWTHLEVSIASAVLETPGGGRLREGEDVHAIYINLPFMEGRGLFIDNVVVSEPAEPAGPVP